MTWTLEILHDLASGKSTKFKVRPCRTCDRRATSHKLVAGYWVCQRCGRKTKAGVDYGE